MQVELEPCPFCGGEAEIIRNDIGVFIGCFNEDCPIGPATSTYVDGYTTEAEAIAAWNSRAERTCENVGYYIDGTRFKCSECGYNGWTKWAKDGEDRIPNYCPHCGAKVVA